MGLSLPGAALMTIIGGFLLGQWVGTGAVVIGATPGSFVYTSLGVALQDLIQSPNFSADLIMKPSILLALTGLGLLSLLPLLYQKYGQKKGQKKK